MEAAQRRIDVEDDVVGAVIQELSPWFSSEVLHHEELMLMLYSPWDKLSLYVYHRNENNLWVFNLSIDNEHRTGTGSSLPEAWVKLTTGSENLGPIVRQSMRQRWHAENTIQGTPIEDMSMYHVFGKQPLLAPLDEFVPWWLKAGEQP
jgi:hypothetical protein